MKRRILGRGFTVLALIAALALAGAGPAAAQERGFFEQGLHWLAALWGGDSTAAGAPETRSMTSLWGATEQIDKGLGVDPNGGSIVLEPIPVGGN